jgi:hypothetical protein
MSIFSNSHHLEWVVQQWDTILKGDHLSNISAEMEAGAILVCRLTILISIKLGIF